jgi:hypothetical protein
MTYMQPRQLRRYSDYATGQIVRGTQANLGGRAVYCVYLRSPACCDCGFVSRQRHGYLCCVLYSKDHETSTKNVHTENKRRTSQRDKKSQYGQHISLCSKTSTPALRPTHPGSFPEIKRPEREVSHSPSR